MSIFGVEYPLVEILIVFGLTNFTVSNSPPIFIFIKFILVFPFKILK